MPSTDSFERHLRFSKSPQRNRLNAYGWSCLFTINGREIGNDSFEYLSSERCSIRWVPVFDGILPKDAVIGGLVDGNAAPICRASHAGGTHMGRVAGRSCSIGYDNRETLKATYEVLVE